MTTVGEGEGMGLSTRYSYYFFILKCHNFGWKWLVWLAVSILEKVLGVIKPKLSIGGFSPSKNQTISRESHRMRISTSKLYDKLTL
jgi:hypothetical protein